MAAVYPITDSVNAPSSSLVLPPSTTTQPALSLPPSSTSSTQATGQTASTTQPSTAASAPSATDTAPATTPTATSPLGTTQPLAVVLDALATAGVDTAVNQELLAPTIGEATGTFSIFMEELFTALAAQSAAAQQSADTAAAQQVTPVTTQTPASTALNAFATTSQSTAPNSALENDVQNLAQSVNAQTSNPTLAAEAASQGANSLTPLQQSFDQFVADAGGSPASSSLGGFLQALASNLHTAQTPLGNIVNSQT